MLHSDHIDGKNTHSFIKAHQIAYQLEQLAKKHNKTDYHIKVLTKRQIICNNLASADAMIVCNHVIEDWLDNFTFIKQNRVSCIRQENNLLLFDI